MEHDWNRRRVLSLIGVGMAAAIGPIALGWQRLLAEATDYRTHDPWPLETPPTPPNMGTTGQLLQAPPAEEIIFIGHVVEVLDVGRFIGLNKQFSGVTVDFVNATQVYPKGHVARTGDEFSSRGKWLGIAGQSTFQVELVDFNIQHIRGSLSTSGIADLESNYTMRDASTGTTWQLVIKASNIVHFTIHSTSPRPTDALLTFQSDTGADVIGYEVRKGVLVVTWLEAHP